LASSSRPCLRWCKLKQARWRTLSGQRRIKSRQIVSASACPRCSGQGQIIESPCPECSGAGRLIEEKTYTVDVPAGVDEGSTLRLTGRGAVGVRGGAPGGGGELGSMIEGKIGRPRRT